MEFRVHWKVCSLKGVIPKPGMVQPGEGSRLPILIGRSFAPPEERYAQDDAKGEEPELDRERTMSSGSGRSV